MKIFNMLCILFLLLGGIAMIVIAVIAKAYFHIGTGAGLLLLSAVWRKEAKSI